MVFIAAGMGGGTGTGAAAVIARTARELGILTVGVVCKPFQFEGARRMRIAEAGVQHLRQHVDTLIVIPNQNLFRIANERTTFAEAFVLADQVLYSGVACIVELVLKEGLINLDFADVRAVMCGMGSAMMGTGESSGERRAILAAEEAIANPLLDDLTLKGAKGLLLSITGGRDMTLYEVDEAASRVREEVDPDANIIVGATFDDNLGDRIRVSIVASGMSRQGEQQAQPRQPAASPFASSAPAPFIAGQPPSAQNQPARSTPAPQPSPWPSAPPHQQHAPREEDVQRRLSEALAPAAQAPRYGEQPTPHAQGGNRDSWTAPGNVIIEEGLNNFPQLSGSALSQTPPLPHEQGYQPSNHSEFQPQPPVEMPRGARRMPTIDDMPPVAQREWHARQNEQAMAREAHTDEGRKQGFFGRLTGLGRKPHETRSPQAEHHPDRREHHDVMPAKVGHDKR
jgi:cell division protein FtsZ